jgi:DNA repair exonuclease SbcCD ATPase subunit
MKSIFYVLALLAIAAGAYFSYDNMSKFEEQVETKNQYKDQDDSVLANIAKRKKELETAVEELKNAESDKQLVIANIDKLKSDKDALSRELGELEATLEEQEAKLEAARQGFANAKSAIESLGLPIDGEVNAANIKEVIGKLEDQKKELNAELQDLDQANEGLKGQIADNRSEIARLADRKADRSARFRSNAMESVITAVNNEWGFVVIGAGKSSGFTPQTRLIVKRGGRAIAEVAPSSIEASQTIAEIDYDTVAPGVMLQPGDRVILSTPANF